MHWLVYRLAHGSHLTSSIDVGISHHSCSGVTTPVVCKLLAAQDVHSKGVMSITIPFWNICAQKAI